VFVVFYWRAINSNKKVGCGKQIQCQRSCHKIVLTWAEDAVDTVKFFLLSPRLIMQNLVAVYYIVRVYVGNPPKLGTLGSLFMWQAACLQRISFSYVLLCRILSL